MKIAVVKLRQFRKLRLVEHRHAPPVDIDDPIVAQLPDDAVGMHRRNAERFADLLLGQRHFERVTRFPADELLVAGRTYVRGADLVAQGDLSHHDGAAGMAGTVAAAAVVEPAGVPR